MKINFFSVILLASLVFIGFSCKNRSNIDKKVTKKISDKELREKLFLENTVDYDFFYTKIFVDFKNKNGSQSFKSSVKMKVDSAFSGTISYGGFIFGTYLLTKDSIMSTNKREKCYYMENLSYVSSLIGVELEYDFFESIILGKPIGLDEEIKYKQIKNKSYYVLSSHSKHKFQKIEKDKINLDNERNDNIYMQYYFSPDSLDLVKMNIEIPVDSVSIDVNYVEKTKVDNYKVPALTSMIIKHPQDSITIQLDYSKTKINERKTISFNVSDSYVDCNQ